MKKFFLFALVFLLCFSCAACSTSSEKGSANADPVAVELPKKALVYAPGTTIETDFGSVTVADAAFCSKAQIFYTKTSRTSKTTVNGKTTETYTETIHPGTVSAKDNCLVFALRTVVTNTTSEPLDLHNIKARAYFSEDDPIGLSKGGNFHISDEGYKVIPAGSSAEIIMAGLVPVDSYLLTTECLVNIEGSDLGFKYDNINIYNVLGYMEGNNAPVSIDEVIQVAANTVSNQVAATEPETEPQETEPAIETFPGTYKVNGTARADGRAFVIENVTIGFRDQLPARILDKYSYKAEELTLNDSQVYSVIAFTATNLTTETVDLADIHDDFMVQLNYNNGYIYSTNTDVYAVYESGSNYKLIRKSASSGRDIAVSPLTSLDVVVYIPCARQVAENPDKPLIVSFISKYSGSESLEFSFDMK